MNFVAAVGGGAHSAVSVIQLKRNTCKTFLRGIFMKNAKIPQLHFSLLAATWHTQVTNALFSQAWKKWQIWQRKICPFCFEAILML